jgi:nitroreductase
MSPLPNNISASQFSEFLASRRSTRDFLSTSIPPEILNQILTDALTAPSWSNTRPYKIAIATGDVRDRISKEFQDRWSFLAYNLKRGLRGKLAIALNRKVLPSSNRIASKPYHPDLMPASKRIGKELFKQIGIARDDKKARDDWWARNYDFHGAPTEIFVYFHKSLGIFAASDAALMMENLTLSAHAHGLGICMQGAVSVWDDVVRKEFDIPKNYHLLCGIAIGYPSDAPINNFKAHRISPEEMIIPAREKYIVTSVQFQHAFKPRDLCDLGRHSGVHPWPRFCGRASICRYSITKRCIPRFYRDNLGFVCMGACSSSWRNCHS